MTKTKTKTIVKNGTETDSVSVGAIDEQKNSTHMRITIERDEALILLPKLIAHFNNRIISYVFAFEQKPNNNHIHGHVLWSKPVAHPTMSDFMGKHGKLGKWSNQPMKEPYIHSQVYCTKDLDILLTNYDDVKIQSLIAMNIAINEDKKKDMRDKLLALVKDNEKIDTMDKLMYFIYEHYITVLHKEPPFTHIKGYMAYISFLVPRIKYDYLKHTFQADTIKELYSS